MQTTDFVKARGPKAVRCLACSPLQPNPAPQQAGAAETVTLIKVDDGLHAPSSCRPRGKGSVGGKRAKRHWYVNQAIARCARENNKRPSGPVRVDDEPMMADFATAKLAGQAESRADIAVTMPNGDVVLIDTSMALPRAAAPKVPGKAVVGAGADARVKEKMAKYEREWTLHPNVQIVIAAVKVGSRWCSRRSSTSPRSTSRRRTRATPRCSSTSSR